MCFDFKKQYKKETAELIRRLKNKKMNDKEISNYMKKNKVEIFGSKNIWSQELVSKIFFAYF